MIKRRKVVQAHIDSINEIIDDLIKGKLGSADAAEYVNKKAEEVGIEKISKYTVQNLIEEILQDTPDKLKEYKQNRAKIIGMRNAEIISDEVKTKIIEQELPRILSSEIELSKVAKIYEISSKSVINIIERYLKSDEKEYKRYKEIVRKNIGGATIEQSRVSKEKIEKISSIDIATKEEFLLLQIEQQREMASIKYLQNKLKEKNSKGINDKETIDRKVQEKVKYFLERNLNEENIGNLTEEDVLYMMYRFPTMIGYSIEDKIGKMIKYLEDEANLGFEQTSSIVRTFPAIFGYSVERTRSQIQILENNNKVDAMIEHPMRLMYSPELIHALIEFAKQKHETNNLDDVKNTNIFLTNKRMKKRYNVTHEELKERFPLKEIKTEHSADEELKEIALGENTQSQNDILLETKKGIIQPEQVKEEK